MDRNRQTGNNTSISAQGKPTKKAQFAQRKMTVIVSNNGLGEPLDVDTYASLKERVDQVLDIMDYDTRAKFDRELELDYNDGENSFPEPAEYTEYAYNWIERRTNVVWDDDDVPYASGGIIVLNGSEVSMPQEDESTSIPGIEPFVTYNRYNGYKEGTFASATGSELVDGSKWGYKRRVRSTVTAELKSLGDQAPYFSCTQRISVGKIENIVSSGPVDADLADVPRSLRRVAKAVAKVHLADERGIPMHAEENALYWAGLSSMEPKLNNEADGQFETDSGGLRWYPQMLARHLRIGEAEATRLRHKVAGSFDRKLAMSSAVEVLKPRWLEEAKEAVAAIREYNGGVLVRDTEL
jgi:hypothetical protein